MKLDLLGLSINTLSWYFSFISIMFNGKTAQGNSAPGLTRHLLFIAKDPIGWRIQVGFRSFSRQYEQNYLRYIQGLQQQQKDRMRPVKTGGVKERPNPNPIDITLPDGQKATYDMKELNGNQNTNQPTKVVPLYPPGDPQSPKDAA